MIKLEDDDHMVKIAHDQIITRNWLISNSQIIDQPTI